MSVTDALNRGKDKHKEAVGRKNLRRMKNPLTANGFLQTFRLAFEKKYGSFPMVSVRDANMLKGFIKLCQMNEKGSDEIYPAVIEMIERWEELKNIPTETLKGVTIPLPARPTLNIFLICRDSLLLNLEQAKKHDTFLKMKAKPSEAPRPKVKERSRKTPTQADTDREYYESLD